MQFCEERIDKRQAKQKKIRTQMDNRMYTVEALFDMLPLQAFEAAIAAVLESAPRVVYPRFEYTR